MTGKRTKLVKLTASAAAFSVLFGGVTLGGGFDQPAAYAAKPKAAAGAKAVAKAEAAVLASPRDVAARAALGAAYLNAGRFASAAQSYDDALNLGDESAATVLGLVLAEVAQGNIPSALELLRDYRDVIPASDLGLAYALAGDTDRGVTLLADAMRAGEDSVKVRQNLAYALALNGQWAEAKLMVAQDLPADQVNARILEWIKTARPDAVQARVASLIGVVPVADSGQPERLALATFPGTDAVMAEASAPAVAPVLTPEPAAPAPVQQAAAELPSVEVPAAAPAPAPVAFAALEAPMARVASDAPAFAAVSLPAATVSKPVAKPRVAGKFAAQVKDPIQAGKGAGMSALISTLKAVAGGSHWVQLGSYTNPAVAKDGWGKFTRRTPALKAFKAVTTTAVVKGTPVWRVAASGFGSYADAKAMCDRVKARGGACLVKRAEVNPGAISALRR